MYEIINVNNATVIYSRICDFESAAVGIFFRIGSRFEEKRLKGIAHFLEHMVFKGTARYSHRRITQEIEGRGGHLNAFTAHEMTAYHANFLRKNLSRTLDILLDMAFRPLLRQCDIDKERNVILEEIKMYNDLPSSRALVLLDSLLWRDHPLGEEIIGYAETVSGIQGDDLKHFRDKYYVPANMVISCSGGFSREYLCGLISQRVSFSHTAATVPVVAPQTYRGVHIAIEHKSLEQSHLCVGFRSVSYMHRERLVVRLINTILGANMSSRLFEELREKRSLCYDISSDVRYFKDSGAFIIHTGLDKSNIIDALLVIAQQLRRMKDKLVLQKELARAKDYLLGQIAMSLEVPQGRMWHSAQSYLTVGFIHDFLQLKKMIEAITPEQIQRVSQKIFSFNAMAISCVGAVADGLSDRIHRVAEKEFSSVR